MSTYMKIADIPGNVTAKEHEKKIEITKFDFEISRPNHLRVGQTQNRLPGIPSISTLRITKPLDESTQAFVERILTGQVIDQIEISICRTDKTLMPYVTHTLKNILVTHYSKSHATGSFPLENIEFAFTKIQTDYYPTDETGSPAAPNRLAYDLVNASML